MKLAINPAHRASWTAIDDHGTHALVVDDFLLDPEAVRAAARTLPYRAPAAPDNYPGVKAIVSVPGAAATKTWGADQFLARLFPAGRPAQLRTDEYDGLGAFCIFGCDRDHPPRGLEDQHTDGFAWLASLIHLSSNSDDRGTAFWEHRPTGLQQWLALDPVRMARLAPLGLELAPQLARAVTRTGVTSTADVSALMRSADGRRPFTLADDAQWRLLAHVPAKFNRLVLYPTWQIHSIVDTAPDATTFDAARLTFNQMIEYPVVRAATQSRTPYPAAFYRPPGDLED